MKTWKILVDERSESNVVKKMPLDCPNCGQEAMLEARGHGPLVIASIGLKLILDPPSAEVPDDWMPKAIQCRKCHKIFDSREEGEQ